MGRMGFRIWLLAAGLLILMGIFVPYGLLSGGMPGIGIFTFWCAFGGAVIALIVTGVARWRR